MPDLEELIQTDRVAVLTMEIQRGIVGDLSNIPALQKVVYEAGMIPNTRRVVDAARAAGVRVIHCTAAFRGDRAGSYHNVPMVEVALRNPEYLLTGSPEAQVVQELGPEPDDLLSERLHGMSPFTFTPVDAWLRSERATTIIATGVSLNTGIQGVTIEAINRGYDVVIPTDCVVGYPREYGEQVIEHTLSKITTLTTSGEIAALWGRSG